MVQTVSRCSLNEILIVIGIQKTPVWEHLCKKSINFLILLLIGKRMYKTDYHHRIDFAHLSKPSTEENSKFFASIIFFEGYHSSLECVVNKQWCKIWDT